MNYSFRTIQGPAEGMYKEKGSKFLAFAYPVNDEEEIKAHVERLKKQYHDARHHCFAWILGSEKDRFRAFDDGEPAHSAGDPILGQLRQHNVTDIVMVVVRYFGGIKLGVGNLAVAYRSAARDALAQATVVEREVKEEFLLEFPYLSTSEVMKLVKAFDLEIVEQHFQEDCQMKVHVGLRNKEAFLERISLLQALKVEVRVG